MILAAGTHRGSFEALAPVRLGGMGDGTQGAASLGKGIAWASILKSVHIVKISNAT